MSLPERGRNCCETLEVLRFGKPGKDHSLGQLRLRIWLLFGILLVVLAAIQFLEREETIARLDSVFNPQPRSGNSKLADPTLAEVSEGAFRLASNPPSTDDSESPALPENREDATKAASANGGIARWFAGDLSGVRDNTYFRGDEADAWFAILVQLRSSSADAVRHASQGLLSYVQLLEQPEIYRGQVVTITGRMMQQELVDAPPNAHGFQQYHRLTIQSTGGGVWPIMVYALDVPAEYLAPTESHPAVTVHGVFFKNWSYAWEEGLGIAPALLAKSVTREPPEQGTVASGKAPETSTSQVPAKHEGGFREVVQLMGYSVDEFERLGKSDVQDIDWKLLLPLVARLQSSNSEDLEHWTQPQDQSAVVTENVGQLLEVEATVTGVSAIDLPADSATLVDFAQIYRCQLELKDEQHAEVLVPEVPAAWLSQSSLSEPVRFRGVLVTATPETSRFVAAQLAWFPAGGANSGKELLAHYGMDAALWEGITQRTPFEGGSHGRESAAFYSALASLERLPAAEFQSKVVVQLQRQASDSSDSRITDRKIERAIQQRAQEGYSSVVPLFLVPETQVGSVVKLVGTARRAVRIATGEWAVNSFDCGNSYYELDLFTPDSQDLPIVCCVNRLPEGFPLGDAIREPVEVEGVFFKTWRYRTRELSASGGQTASQRTSYTPVVLGQVPRWLPPVAEAETNWQLTAGILFLVVLAGAWGYFSWQARRDRKAKRTEPQTDFSQLDSKLGNTGPP